MSIIRVHDKEFGPYLGKELIDEKIQAIADAMNRDYADKRPLFIAILNGAFMFASDLFKKISIEAEISFIKLASYKGTKSSAGDHGHRVGYRSAWASCGDRGGYRGYGED